jgi:rhodanese-related sulfurtransferase
MRTPTGRLTLLLGLLLLAGACGDAASKALGDTQTGDQEVLLGDLGTLDTTPNDTARQDTAQGDDLAADTTDEVAPLVDTVPGDSLLMDSDSPDTGPDTALDTLEDLGPATLGSISVADLVLALEAKDFLLINVHVPYDGEIPGTDANITYQDIAAVAAYIGDDLGAKVVVYCKSNYMSKLAGNALVDLGYRGISYLDGGMSAWTQAGQQLEYLQ